MSYVTLVHHAKAVGRNEMPFSRDTRVVQSSIVLDRGPGPPTGRGVWEVGTPSSSDAAYRQITLTLFIRVRVYC